jgi:hypothetical protein
VRVACVLDDGFLLKFAGEGISKEWVHVQLSNSVSTSSMAGVTFSHFREERWLQAGPLCYPRGKEPGGRVLTKQTGHSHQKPFVFDRAVIPPWGRLAKRTLSLLFLTGPCGK